MAEPSVKVPSQFAFEPKMQPKLKEEAMALNSEAPRSTEAGKVQESLQDLGKTQRTSCISFAEDVSTLEGKGDSDSETAKDKPVRAISGHPDFQDKFRGIANRIEAVLANGPQSLNGLRVV